ncbi:MAG: hypothetical protein JWQ48_2009 [Conexibacter sp.]|nr:hypothetical protein [Conexibacter sp.]
MTGTLSQGDRPAPPRDALDELADEVLAIAGSPIDAWAVAATLESRGVRDIDAVRRYGRDDVFDLADYVLARCRERARPAPLALATQRSRRARLLSFARLYVRGGFFFFSMALQIGALIAFGYSQWASVDFTLTQASTIALAASASFVASAGGAQALGQLGPRFRDTDKGMLTERLAWACLAVGALATLVGGGVLVGANALLGSPYPAHLVAVGTVYYALLAALWLANGLLYMLRAYGAMAIATVAGVASVVILRGGAGLGIYAAQWIALGLSVAVALGWGAVILRREARQTRGELRLARFEPSRLLVRAATPAFLFGTLYFAFVLCDRLVAWSAGDHPLPLWFDVDYELGLDLALVAVVPGLAFLEPAVEAFSERVAEAQERFAAGAVAQYNREMLRFYRRHLLVAAGLALAGGALASLAVLALDAAGALGPLAGYVHGTVSPRVFVWGVAGYLLLTWGLLTASLLMALARPWPVVGALVVSVLVDATVGLALSRSGAGWEAVAGLAAGGATFAALTTAAALRTLRRSDFYYLAAY